MMESILINMMRGERLTAAEAAARLGIKPATLYAYVSRGLLDRERSPGGRTSTFDPAEVERLTRRGHGARRGRRPAAELMVESALTAIEGGALWYRGLPVTELAATRTFEEVAEWLWSGRFPGPTRWRAGPAALAAGRRAQAALPQGALPLERLRVIAATLAAGDDLRLELHPAAVTAAGRALIAGLAGCLPRLGRPPARDAGVAARLWSCLSQLDPDPALLAVLDAALVLVADHELAASTVAARVAASVRADPYAVAAAGLATVSGSLHGGASLAVEALLAEIERPGLALRQAKLEAGRVLGERLRRGERLRGLGHPLYPDGDPRAAYLLARLRRAAGGSPRMAVVDALLAATRRRGLPPPNVDLALAALCHVAGMTRGAGEAIFAVARVAGWIAHALEEYERATPIRLRAVYTGPPPTPA
jgi:citrate synthase